MTTLIPNCTFSWISLKDRVSQVRKLFNFNRLRNIHYRKYEYFSRLCKPLQLSIVTAFFVLYPVSLNGSLVPSTELSPNAHRNSTGYTANSSGISANHVRNNLTSPIAKPLQVDKSLSHSTIDFEKLAKSIHRAENSKKYPYGILKKFKHTSPKQACLNTINSAYKRYRIHDQREDFISYLAKTYAPRNATNDPNNLNQNWPGLVRHFYNKEML